MNRCPQSGFKVQPDDLEMTVVEREPETILQRYQRLKQEVCACIECGVWSSRTYHSQVADLASDVDKIAKGNKDTEQLLQVSPPDLLQDVCVESMCYISTIMQCSLDVGQIELESLFYNLN